MPAYLLYVDDKNGWKTTRATRTKTTNEEEKRMSFVLTTVMFFLVRNGVATQQKKKTEKKHKNLLAFSHFSPAFSSSSSPLSTSCAIFQIIFSQLLWKCWVWGCVLWGWRGDLCTICAAARNEMADVEQSTMWYRSSCTICDEGGEWAKVQPITT